MSEFFDALEKAKHIGVIIASNIIPERSSVDTLQKGKAANIGEVREWSGKKYKKQANGNWVEVSGSYGMTKQQHHEASKSNGTLNHLKGDHAKTAESLSDKEHSDEEVGLGKKEEHKKGDRIEHNGVTIHVGKDTSGGQDTLTYKAPSVSDKTFWDLGKLKELIGKEKSGSGSKFPTKEDLIQRLVKVGNNPDDSKKMVEKHYDYVKRVYPDSTPKQLAEVIRTIY